MLQSKTLNHSFCKFNILLLILEDFPNSVEHNYTYVMVPNSMSSVTSKPNLFSLSVVTIYTIHICCNIQKYMYYEVTTISLTA